VRVVANGGKFDFVVTPNRSSAPFVEALVFVFNAPTIKIHTFLAEISVRVPIARKRFKEFFSKPTYLGAIKNHILR
jgi:hypothetical protein